MQQYSIQRTLNNVKIMDKKLSIFYFIINIKIRRIQQDVKVSIGSFKRVFQLKLDTEYVI